MALFGERFRGGFARRGIFGERLANRNRLLDSDLFSFGVSYLHERRGCMATNAVYIERREQGDYAVREPGSERAERNTPNPS